jgi:glycosyltransferase involved in cell wall biosynthesis
MRIGIMLRHLPTELGGIGRYTKSLLHGLLSIDTKNEYFLFHQDAAATGAYSTFPNVRELFKPSPSKFFWDHVIVPHWIRELSIDLIFSPKISVPLRNVCRSVLMMHGADWFEAPQNYSLPHRVYHGLAATLYSKRADAIIAASGDAAERLARHIPAARGKLVAIHHGVNSEFKPITDSHRLDAMREKYRLPERFILYVGKIYPMKNVGGIITAFSLVRGDIPHKLVIVGPAVGRAESELAPIKRYNLEQDVMVLGRVPDEDLPEIYSLADLFLFPSLYEGFGIPLLEAMACGCPVVTSFAGSCPEVVGEAARLVDPRDAQAIATAALEVVTNAGLAQTLRAKGLQRAKAFTWEKCARETLAVFERCV